ncbi:MAG TPA: hypothetical protein VGQ93_17520 [Lysobacter sp.]|nr:hypothetical protein [Lysobacter sp.]
MLWLLLVIPAKAGIQGLCRCPCLSSEATAKLLDFSLRSPCGPSLRDVLRACPAFAGMTSNGKDNGDKQEAKHANN